MNIKLHGAGLSLFTGQVTVYDGNGNQVAAAAATDPLNNDLSIHLSSVQSTSTYYVKVQSARTDVFGIGAYKLTVDLNPGGAVFGQNPFGKTQVLQAQGGAALPPLAFNLSAQILSQPIGPVPIGPTGLPTSSPPTYTTTTTTTTATTANATIVDVQTVTVSTGSTTDPVTGIITTYTTTTDDVTTRTRSPAPSRSLRPPAWSPR